MFVIDIVVVDTGCWHLATLIIACMEMMCIYSKITFFSFAITFKITIASYYNQNRHNSVLI